MTRVVQPRLRRWVDRSTVAVLLVVDVVIGLVWMFGGPERTAAPAYRVAEGLAPIQTYGAVLLLLALGVLALHRLTPASTTIAWAALGAYWAFWAALVSLVAVFEGTASAYGPGSGVVLAVVHIGTALTRED